MRHLFSLTGKVIVITGGSGFLGQKHAEAVAKYGATPVLLDIESKSVSQAADRITAEYGANTLGLVTDITREELVKSTCHRVIDEFGKVDVLINNAANNPKVDSEGRIGNSSRLEDFELDLWNADLAVGLTGAFLCAKYFGAAIAKNPFGGAIINISSDLGVIAPDQRLYRKEGIPDNQQPVKPVTYSVVKTGLIGLTRYLATYWAEKNVRCNALCPGGVKNDQDEAFLDSVQSLIPLGRMANRNEYMGAIVFMCSDSASYLNGAILSMDGGRSVW